MFMMLLLSAVFIGAVAIIAVSSLFLTAQLMPVLKEVGYDGVLMNALIQSSIGSFVLALTLVALVFFAIGRYIARPLSEVTEAMQAFADTGQKQPMPASWAPKEVRTLRRVFDVFTSKVEEVHAHDVEISRIKSDFISTAAHQLRTPLTGIRWALEALQMEPLTDSQKTLVASATEKSHQLVSVVGTLLDISSIESGKYKYDMKRTALNDVVDEVVRDFAALANTSRVSLLFEKTGDASAVVSIDRERVRWVLNNLVENAIKYTPAGGSVRVTTEQAPERAYVRVRDTGIGIPEQDRGNIFQRFYRASNAVSKENGGNGLGLYIARTIATDHGGDLNFAQNENGTGTTFTLSLPLA